MRCDIICNLVYIDASEECDVSIITYTHLHMYRHETLESHIDGGWLRTRWGGD
jgi:hypothetical protein